MNPTHMRYFLWGGVLLLCSVLLFSCVEEKVGHDHFHEISCTTDSPRSCAPSGRHVVATRTPGDKLAKPPKPDAARIEVYNADDRLESRADMPNCMIKDVRNFVCRKPPGPSIGVSSGPDTAPWHMVQGRLFYDQGSADHTHYLNSLDLWKNRLSFGDYEHAR